MSLSEELLQIAKQLNEYADYETSRLEALAEAARRVGTSWSGSTMGYHSRVYYANFQPPPRGTVFDPISGLDPDVPPEKSFGWREYERDSIIRAVREKADNLPTETLSDRYGEVTALFEEVKLSVLSLVYANHPEGDKFLQGLLDRIDALDILFNRPSVDTDITQTQVETIDRRALEEGPKIPPHVEILELALGAKQAFETCNVLRNQISVVARHIQHLEKKVPIAGSTEPIGDDVFIVHGRDEEAKQTVARFVEKLELKAIILDEQPNSGLTIIEKFEQLASDAGFAIVLLTPDDVGALKEEADEQLKLRARQNVILELGYFMGKLGRERVCLLLKGDLENPSDLDGILYVSMDNPDSWQLKLGQEMRNAGLPVDLNKL